MTVTLTYDSVLARVRLSADTLGAADVATVERSTDLIRWTTIRGGVDAVPFVRADLRDTFTRSGSNGWSTSDTGQTWSTSGAAAADYSTNGTKGVHSNATVNVLRHSLINVGTVDQDVTVTIDFSAVATGAPFTTWLAARVTDTSHYYVAHLEWATTGTVSLRIQKRVAGALTQLALAAGIGSYAAGTQWMVRIQVSGALLRAKAWLATVPEPVAWTLAASDSSLTTGTQAGCFTRLEGGNTNPLPVTSAFDNFVAGPRVVELDDYEFVPGTVNHYRIRGVETGPIEFVGAGTAATGNNSSVVPGHPSTPMQPNDLKLVLASIRNSGTGTVNTPADWSVVRSFGNLALLGKYHVAGDTAPTVTFAGGVANADTLGQMGVWRRADIVPVTGNDQLNGSAQNVAHPALTIPEDDLLILLAAWKQDDTSGVSTLAGMTEVGEASSTAGDDASQAWDQVIQATLANIASGTFTFGGGGAAISRAMAVALKHTAYLNEQTSTITPVLDRIWLKSVQRPFLNRAVTVVEPGDPSRPSRSGSFDATGRTLAIGVTDVMGGKEFDLQLHTPTPADAQTLDYIAASGDILFLHTPPGCAVPSGHVLVRGSGERRPRPRAQSRVFTLPLQQIAAPGPDVVGATVTWQTVLDTYPTWQALLDANPTWADLLARIAPPGEVIVP